MVSAAPRGAVLEAPAATAAGLDAVWAELGAPGAWYSGAERAAIADEVRRARACALCAERKAALTPAQVARSHDARGPLPASTVDAVHRITTDPGRLTARWYEQVLASDVTAEQLVELTGIVGVVVLADTLAAGLGQDERPLPQVLEGPPSRERPEGLIVDRAWVPMVAPERAEGAVALVYATVEAGAGFVFNVARALTAVPVALRQFLTAFGPNYNTHGEVPPGGLSRPQVEVLASSTSALNDCFY